jgi:hypothetical protein
MISYFIGWANKWQEIHEELINLLRKMATRIMVSDLATPTRALCSIWIFLAQLLERGNYIWYLYVCSQDKGKRKRKKKGPHV